MKTLSNQELRQVKAGFGGVQDLKKAWDWLRACYGKICA